MTEEAIVLGRVSSPEQESNGNHIRQAQKMEDIARGHGYENIHVFLDVCNKNTPFGKRENMPRLIEHLEKNKGIHRSFYMEDLDRIAGTKDIIAFTDRYIRKEGCRLYSLKDGDWINLTDWEGFQSLVRGKRIEEKDRVRYQRTRQGEKEKAKNGY